MTFEMSVTVRIEWKCGLCSKVHAATSHEYDDLQKAEIFVSFMPTGWTHTSDGYNSTRSIHRCDECNEATNKAVMVAEQVRRELSDER